MTPSNGVAESAATALAAKVTQRRPTGPLRVKMSRVRVRQSRDLTTLPPPMSQGLNQKQTLRSLRRRQYPKRNPRRLLQILCCLSLWTTSGRTSPSSTSLPMPRVVNYIWILCWIRYNPTAHALGCPRGDGKEGQCRREAPNSGAPAAIRRSPMGTPNQFQVFQWSLKNEAENRHPTASTSINLRDMRSAYILSEKLSI